MRELSREIEAKEFELLEKKMELIAEKAYLKGVEDGKTKMAYHPTLRKEHLCEIFQCSLAMVNKLIARFDYLLMDLQKRDIARKVVDLYAYQS